MEKLTIKELAPYLPYGLKLYIWNGGYEKPIEYPTLTGLHGDSIIQSGYRFKSIHCGDEIFSRPEMSNSLSIIKPLLRPFSQLTEEIEHNGERFVPMVELEKIHKGIIIYQPLNLDYPVEITIQTEDYSQEIDLYDGHLIIQKLHEWHFDVFGLIDRGLALPIDRKEVEGDQK